MYSLPTRSAFAGSVRNFHPCFVNPSSRPTQEQSLQRRTIGRASWFCPGPMKPAPPSRPIYRGERHHAWSPRGRPGLSATLAFDIDGNPRIHPPGMSRSDWAGNSIRFRYSHFLRERGYGFDCSEWGTPGRSILRRLVSRLSACPPAPHVNHPSMETSSLNYSKENVP